MFDGFKKILRAPEAKASRTAKVLAFESGGRARWTPRDYAALAQEGYLTNAIVHRAVRLIAENAASCGFLLYEGAAEREAHPLSVLLTRPNARQDGASFFEALYAHMLLAGNAYIEAVALGEEVRELHALRPDRMRVVPGHDGWAEAYEYSVAGRSVRFDQLASNVPPILHLTFFHPLDDHYGLAPIEAAAVAVDAAIQISVRDTGRTSPPLAPAEGDRHIVAAGATGAWTGQALAIATYEDGAWRFLTPKAGWCAWSGAAGALLVFDGAAWADVAGGGGGIMSDRLARLGINATASAPNLLTVRSNAALFEAVEAADAGTGDMRVQISKEGSAHTASVVFSNAFSGRAEFGLVESDAFKLKVSNDGSTFVEALTFDQDTGNAALQRGLALSGAISPTQITSARNDYAPAGFAAASTLRLSSDATRTISGLAGGAEGRTVIVHNVGSQNIILTNQDAASTDVNRFLLGGHATLAADASLSLRYDGTTQRWRAISPTAFGGGGGGGGSTAGMTDTERRNAQLALIYQSKSFADCRRLVNVFATGFKGASDALNGILTGSSSNYTVTPGAAGAATGSVAPSITAPVRVSPNNMISNTAPSPFVASSSGNDVGAAWNAYDGSAGISNVWYRAGLPNWNTLDFGAATAVGSYTLQHRTDSVDVAPAAWTIKGSNTGAFAGEEVTVDTQSGQTFTTGQSRTYTLGSSAKYRYFRITITASTGTTGALIGELTYFSPPTANNMTLVTVAQTADSAVSNARVLIEYDDTAAPALNTDLTVEVTCDGGANWASAPLASVTSYSQGGRKVAETADTGCAPGTDFRARVKTLNNKSVAVYGVSLTVH